MELHTNSTFANRGNSYQVTCKPDDKMQSDGKFRSIILSQFCGVCIFILGLVGGILIGIFAYHGSPNSSRDIKCIHSTNMDYAAARDGKNYSQISTTISTIFRVSSSAENVSTESSSISCNACPVRDPINSVSSPGLFDPLSTEEMEESFSALFKSGVIPTKDPPVTFYKNYVQYMSLQPPNKQEALRFLQKQGNPPGRFAKVHVVRSGIHNPDCMIYKVGPLGRDGAQVKQLLADGEAHINTRPKDLFEALMVFEFLKKDMKIMEQLISESFDGANFMDDMYIFSGNSPFGLTSEERKIRFNLAFKGFGNSEIMDLFDLLPLQGAVIASSLNVSHWFATDYYYLNQGPFKTAKDLMNSYNNGTIRKLQLPKGYVKTIRDRIVPKRDMSLPVREKADTPGARTYEPAGARYTINGYNISWMGWNFVLSGSQVRGPSLFNIRFKGDRIVYELAFNDVSVMYAADNYAQNNVIYTDATYGILEGEVILGVDCPEHSSVLKIATWNSRTATPIDTSIVCVFEVDGEESLWRHKGGAFTGGQRERHLVIRAPITLGNYDYSLEFHFHLDGRIVTKARASGYIQAHFWDVRNKHFGDDRSFYPYGYRISDFHVGSIHDHTFGFKVDLDILEQNNTFKLIHWKAGNVLDALQTKSNVTEIPSYYLFNQTRYIEWETLYREAGLRIDMENQKFWTVVNTNKQNKWGNSRGYRIIPMATGAQNFDDSFLPMRALSYTKYHCAVTKRKDEEEFLTSTFDVNRMMEPKGYLDLMINNESIVNEDIVNWISVGFLHVPTSEDMPITLNVETGFTLKPHNFFDRSPVLDLPQVTNTIEPSEYERMPKFDQCYEKM
ncbi:hypothetical protein CHS0354_009683 [Potamilus streckersoni]|uniref:Amine oxidase n=1 Tax=Potamilus streckersoni TaxID=2493646 RepID=A0AAE0VXN3_9BIVA|nr:hypothetical protein CHS0354_009683 [Potamilus streckersoni]